MASTDLHDKNTIIICYVETSTCFPLHEVKDTQCMKDISMLALNDTEKYSMVRK